MKDNGGGYELQILDANSGPPPCDAAEKTNLGYPGALELDVEKYRPYVDHFDISEEQKNEFLRTLWSLMSAFVDLGWGVDDAVHRFLPGLKEFSVPELSDDSQQEERTDSGQDCEVEFNQAAGGGIDERVKDER